MGYHKSFVIFIDILGTRDRASDFNEMYKINTIFHEQMEQEQMMDDNHPYVVYERTVHTFSDCAYIIYDFKAGVEENRKNIFELMTIACYNTEKVCYRFLEEGFVFRGGMSYGDVYYEKERSLLFGPAINSAYELEAQKANYPRIVVDPQIGEQLFSYIDENVPKNVINGTILKHDEDGFYYLHYLNNFEFGNSQDNDKEVTEIIYDLCEREIERAQDNEKLTEKQRTSIIGKYKWLDKYITDSQYKGFRDEEIDFDDEESMKRLEEYELELVRSLAKGFFN